MTGGWRVRPTAWGLMLAAVAVAAVLARPSTGDPAVTGVVWAVVATSVLVGGVWPVLSMAALRLDVLAAPVDLVVSETAVAAVAVGRGPVAMGLRATGGPTASVGAGPGVRVAVPVCFAGRGVHDVVELTVVTDAPFGIVRVRRTVRLALPHRLWVAPSARHATWRPGLVGAVTGGGAGPAHPSTGDVARSVRPYVPGDPAHLVHWPTSARSGDLQVRELEPPALVGVAVVLELTEDRERSEALAAVAAGLVEAVRSDGGAVVLCTRGADGPVRRQVVDRRSAGRQLAEAVAGPPAPAPPGWPVERVGPG